jgi:hypothetical protein
MSTICFISGVALIPFTRASACCYLTNKNRGNVKTVIIILKVQLRDKNYFVRYETESKFDVGSSTFVHSCLIKCYIGNAVKFKIE